MKIQVISYIPYLEEISNVYSFDDVVTIEEFLQSLGIRWDDDVLVVVNRVIATDKTISLYDGDTVELLIPLSGG